VVDADVPIPAALAALTADVADEIAAVFGDQVVFPARIEVDRFPGWPDRVLVLSHENQGVVTWGVPLGVPDPPVLVGGDLEDPSGDDWTEGTVVYARSVAEFIAVRRWDAACLVEPLLQAQAQPLDDASLRYLREHYDERTGTTGWPASAQYRFEHGRVKILLWAGRDQCDWWISSPDAANLAMVATALLPLSDLRTSLWSNDSTGDALLAEIRDRPL
jgi:hypothetical protein